MTMRVQFRVASGLMFAAALAALATLLYACLAHAQPASAPASQPVIASGAWVWLSGHWVEVVGVVINLLSTIATGLSDYPAETPAGASKLKKVVRVLRIIIACLGWAQFKNSPGSLKVLGAPPAAPKA